MKVRHLLFLHWIFVQRLIILALSDQATMAAYLRLEILIIQPLINIFKIMYNMENIVQKDIVNIYIQSYRNLIKQTVRILNMVLLHIN